MNRIFVSYSRRDVDFARQLAAALSDAGADVWIDVEDIPAGMKWSSAIQQGLDTADAMLVVVSPDSMASDNVEDEWQYFMDRGKLLIPILWRPAKIHFQLHRKQFIDFHEQKFAAAFVELQTEMARQGITTGGPTQSSTTAQFHPPKPKRIAKLTNCCPNSRRLATAGLVLIVAFIIIGGLLAFVSVVVNDTSSAAVSDFGQPQPPVFFNSEAPFPVHANASGASAILFQSTRVALSLRIFSEEEQQYWFQVNDLDRNESGFQIAQFLPIEARWLALVPVATKPQEETLQLHLEARADAPSATFSITLNPEIFVHGFTQDAEGDVWYQVQILSDADDELLGWWQNNCIGLELALPIVAQTMQAVEAQVAEANGDPITLPAGTQVYLLASQTLSDSGRVIYRAGIVWGGRWQLVGIPQDAVDLKPGMGALLAQPVPRTNHHV